MSFVERLNFWARDACNESAALHAAFSLGVWDHLPDEGATPMPLGALTERVGGIARGVRSVTEPLTGLGFIRGDARRGWYLPRASAAFLRDEAFRSRLERARAYWPAAASLPDAVRTGASATPRGSTQDLLGWYRSLFAEKVTRTETLADVFYDAFARNFLRTQALITAAELGLLDQLSATPQPAEAVARALGLDPGALGLLGTVLETLGIVGLDKGEIHLSPAAAQALDTGSLPYFKRALPATLAYWDALGHLDEAVVKGVFRLDLRDPDTARRLYEENASRISGIFSSHLRLGRSAVDVVRSLRPLSGARVLDVGTGSGVWGAAFALAEPAVHVTYLDSEHVMERVRANVARLGLGERARFWAGDCLSVDFGEAEYDAVLLPQVLPALPPEAVPGLLARLRRALRPGGVLVISGYLLNDDRDGPLDALYFALRRYVTHEGDVYSFPELRAHLRAAGFTDARRFNLPIQQVVIAGDGFNPRPEGVP